MRKLPRTCDAMLPLQSVRLILPTNDMQMSLKEMLANAN
jgi:hypothetical protein